MVVVLVPLFLGIMGFAVDLGRLYLIRGELKNAAEAAALAAAAKMIGTDTGLNNATNAAMATFDNSDNFANQYNFGSLLIGGSTSVLSSNVNAPVFFATVDGAIGEDSGASDTGGDSSSVSKYVQITLNADAPLTWWGLLSLGQSLKTNIAAIGVAGQSAPVCTACGIQPLAIAALDQTDLVNFGYSVGTVYTLGFQCTGTGQPAPLAEGGSLVPYLIIDRYNSGSTFDETQQLYRTGAQGLLPAAAGSGTSSATPSTSFGCVFATGTEVGWASAVPAACTTGPPPGVPNPNASPSSVQELLCGVYSMFGSDIPTVCENLVTDVDSLVTAYTPDPDTTDISDYSTYVGNARRVITVAVIDTLSFAGPMTVLGFRQFLVNPDSGDVNIDPTDTYGRFNAMYIGNPVPVKQGRFDGGCDLANGPGHVVLYR